MTDEYKNYIGTYIGVEQSAQGVSKAGNAWTKWKLKFTHPGKDGMAKNISFTWWNDVNLFKINTVYNVCFVEDNYIHKIHGEVKGKKGISLTEEPQKQATGFVSDYSTHSNTPNSNDNASGVQTTIPNQSMLKSPVTGQSNVFDATRCNLVTDECIQSFITLYKEKFIVQGDGIAQPQVDKYNDIHFMMTFIVGNMPITVDQPLLDRLRSMYNN